MTPMLQPPAWLSHLYIVLFALLPWSFEYSFGLWKLNVPDEPLIAAVGIGLGWFVLKNLRETRTAFSNNFFLQISVAWIGWLGISACFSTMPMVSWKYWVVEAGHWWAFAAGLMLFPAIWQPAIRVFTISMVGVVIYTLVHHSFYHFRADQALLAPMPFFPENTLYAAVLGMVVFASFNPTPSPSPTGRGDVAYAETSSVTTSTERSTSPLPLGEGSGVGLIKVILLTGLLFSFCRAAWISVVLAGAVGLMLNFRKKWRWFALAGISLLIAGFLFRGQIIDKIAKDVSAIERLNRYACAFRMAHDRPWTGFGPGTFQFQYIPYQKPEEMTRISAKEPVTERSPQTYGRGGGAHSEFLQALAETGWPGFLLWTLLASTILGVGFKRRFQEQNKENQRLVLALALSLLTFFLHGLFNNMLHDGRVAALVWGMIAVISSRRQ